MAKSNNLKRLGRFRSLRTVLTVAFLALSVAVLLLAGSLQLYFGFRSQEKIIAHWQKITAKYAANIVEGFVMEEFSSLEKAIALTGLDTASPEEQKLTLERLLGKESSFRQLVLLDTQGQELQRASRLSKALPEQVMEYNENELFSKVSQKEMYVSPVYVDKIASEPMMVIAVPVTDIFGKFGGALIAEVNLKFIWDLVNGIKVGEGGSAYVVDKSGRLIAFRDVSRVLKGENLAYLEEVSNFVLGEDLAEGGPPGISKGIQGTYVLVAYAPLGTPDWAVLVELPIREAYQTVIYGAGLSLAVIVLCVILAIVTGMSLSKRITEPIINLRDVALEIRRGKLDTRAEVKSNDEIGELAVAFNEMAGRLSVYTTELEEKVKERTEELEEAKTSLEIKVAARTRELKELAEKQEETIEKRTKEIQGRMQELERFHRLTVGRELKMIEMKKEMRRLKEFLKQSSKQHD